MSSDTGSTESGDINRSGHGQDRAGEEAEIPSALVQALREAEWVAVMTGAGISAESGIPTFRDGLTGYWARFNPEDLATPQGFRRDPELVSKWYDERRRKCCECVPNAGHRALADLEQALLARGKRFTLITQNVDGLHRKAGSREVIEVHGSLRRWRCTRTGEEREIPDDHEFSVFPPRSEHGGFLRPGVVWFGEELPAEAVARAEEAAAGCDLFLSVGTSAQVFPAAGFILHAQACGAATAEINLEPTPISMRVTWSVLGRSGAILPRLISMAFGSGGG